MLIQYHYGEAEGKRLTARVEKTCSDVDPNLENKYLFTKQKILSHR